ncbi:uncharacterized protein LOC121818299 [Ovis aries]|uniref:uncharacterized protein LOC121818299 n=1 Tax=Ovis aries TaxID=9940 RepID=UPI001C2E4A68|nr:uncharacterized protein LOC121818299 [Ovis aries]
MIFKINSFNCWIQVSQSRLGLCNQSPLPAGVTLTQPCQSVYFPLPAFLCYFCDLPPWAHFRPGWAPCLFLSSHLLVSLMLVWAPSPVPILGCPWVFRQPWAGKGKLGGSGAMGSQEGGGQEELESSSPQGFPDSSVGRESACNAEDPGSIPGSGRSTGEGYPRQYSGLENSMDYHGVTKSRTRLSNFTFTLASAQSGVRSLNTSPEPQPWNSLPAWPSQAGGHFLLSPLARGRPYLRRPGRLYTFLCCGLIATAPRESQRRPRWKETAEEDSASTLTARSRPVCRPHPSGGRARPWLRLGGGREDGPGPGNR